MSNARAGAAVAPLDNAKHERFCREYLVDLNATQAAIRAGYSPNGANRQGTRLLSNVHIASRLETLRAEVEAKTGVTIERIVQELAVVAFASVTHVEVDADGRLRAAEGAPEEAVRAVASVKRTQKTYGKDDRETFVDTTEVRYWNKVEALKALGQHLGMFVERHELTGKDGAPLIPPGRLEPAEIAPRLRAILAARN